MRRAARWRVWVAAAAGLVFTAIGGAGHLGCGSGSGGSGGGGGGAPADVARWDRLELVLDLPVLAANPFDPAEADVRGQFEAPSGSVIEVPAFATRDFERSLASGREVLTATSELYWVVRFAPAEEGNWRWRFVARQRGPAGEIDERSGEWSGFRVGAARDGVHGFLRVSPRDGRYLAYDDGASYLAIGENLCWYDARGTFAYDDWLAKLAAQGATYVRLWMPSWAFGLEWIERGADGAVSASSLGDYEERLDRAWQLDRVIEKARAHGLAVMLSIQNHGPFSTAANTEWVDNPYNAANGGPLARPEDFFTSGEARALFERRLRYLVARFGGDANVFAWELWNEADLADSPGAEALVDWHRTMARTLAALDPARRPVVTSVSGTPAILDLFLGTALFRGLWELPEIAFTQVHLYAVGGLPLDFAHALPLLTEHMGRHAKPVLIGEAGVDFRGPAETLAADPEGVGIHDMLWAGVLGGGFGTGMTWWWDNVVDPSDLYFHFGALARFVAGVELDREGFAVGGAVASARGAALTALALRGRDTTLVWIKNDAHQWFHPDGAPVEGASVTIEGLAAAGRFSARWLDAYGGQDIDASTTVRADASGTITLAAPTFSRDVALRLDRL